MVKKDSPQVQVQNVVDSADLQAIVLLQKEQEILNLKLQLATLQIKDKYKLGDTDSVNLQTGEITRR